MLRFIILRFIILVLTCVLAMAFYLLPVVFKEYETIFRFFVSNFAAAWVWAVATKVVEKLEDPKDTSESTK